MVDRVSSFFFPRVLYLHCFRFQFFCYVFTFFFTPTNYHTEEAISLSHPQRIAFSPLHPTLYIVSVFLSSKTMIENVNNQFSHLRIHNQKAAFCLFNSKILCICCFKKKHYFSSILLLIILLTSLQARIFLARSNVYSSNTML